MKTKSPHQIIFNPKKSGIFKKAFFIPIKVINRKDTEIWEIKDYFEIYDHRSTLKIFESSNSAFFQVSLLEGNFLVEDITYKAYQIIFQQLKKRDLNLVRIWNYVPNILAKQKAVERYRRFNIGRNTSWHELGPKTYSGKLLLPASTMSGILGERINIEVFASKYPVSYLQNPLQTPSLGYSKKWGLKPPAFSRATLLFSPDEIKLFISATASILGEQTVHLNNPKKQTEQILTNIEALISAKNCYQYGFKQGFKLKDLNQVRVYIKNQSDFNIIKKTVENILDPKREIIYLQGEISREELLVELEGVCSHLMTI